MEAHAIPGAAVGLYDRGTQLREQQEYVRGYGITSTNNPTAVDGHTLFRIGSTTKTSTGTAVMRLVEQGRLDLDAEVRTYLPDFAASVPAVAARVTLRQLLNHTSGWPGDLYQDFAVAASALSGPTSPTCPTCRN